MTAVRVKDNGITVVVVVVVVVGMEIRKELLIREKIS